MFNKLFNIFRKKETLDSPVQEYKIQYGDEKPVIVTESEHGGVPLKVGDKVICRSNECGPLLVGDIVGFWDNGGKWTNPVPQVMVEDQIWGVMGHIEHYTDELMDKLTPLRPLEQWNYLLPPDSKDMAYTKEQMDKKEKQYKDVQRIKETVT